MITAIDHPVIAVADMDAARTLYEHLGFTIPPRGSHLEWGTGNWCIMFEKDYLELRGIVDPSKYTHHLEEFLADYGEGLMGLAFATDDAEASHRDLTKRGLHPKQVRQLSRRFEIPGGPVEPRFSLCFLPEAETTGLMSVVLCHHLTPKLLRRPEWLEHENGAFGVASLTGIVPDLAIAADSHQKLFGQEAITQDAGVLAITLNGNQSITLTTSDKLPMVHPGLIVESADDSARLVAITLRTRSLAQIAELLSARAVKHETIGNDRLRVDPSYTCGVVFEFVEE